MATSTALQKRSAASALMPPPPPPKRIRRPQTVLDEDTYTSALSHIIARDFFPDLLETESQQEFLDALDSQDADWIEDAGKRMQAAMTPGRQRGRRGVSMTPQQGLGSGLGGETPVASSETSGFETPFSTAGDATPSTRTRSKDLQKPKVNLNMSLSAFQATYTSEDNESFYKVVDKQNAKRREKQPWLWTNNKLPSKQQIAQAAQQQRALVAKSANSDAGSSAQNKETALIPLSQDLETRPANIDARPYNPKNGLMFTPDDLESTHPGIESRAQAAGAASLAPPKCVNYPGTRIQSSADDAASIPPSPSISAIDAAIAGRSHPALRSKPSLSTVALSDADEEHDEDGSATPRVNGYAFVDEEPTPSELGVVENSPPSSGSSTQLLNQLIATHGSSSGPNPFEIKPSSRRESLHHRMVEKQLASKRKKASFSEANATCGTPVGRTPTPRFASSPRVGALPKGDGEKGRAMGNLTPAARMLWHSIGSNKKGAGDRGGGDVMGKKVWTPTPLRGVKKAS